MSIVIICCQVCDVIYFEINLSPFIKPFLYITKKSGQKFKYLKKEKSFEHEIIFKGLLLKQIKTAFLELESPTLNNNMILMYFWLNHSDENNHVERIPVVVKNTASGFTF